MLSLPEPAPAGTLPDACDVLIIGAGPSGSACATVLAGAGLQVCLVDQHDFPREKVCGDGLIPDAHAALARLGLLDEVMRHATRVSHVRCVAPRGGQVVNGDCEVEGGELHAVLLFCVPILDVEISMQSQDYLC